MNKERQPNILGKTKTNGAEGCNICGKDFSFNTCDDIQFIINFTVRETFKNISHQHFVQSYMHI